MGLKIVSCKLCGSGMRLRGAVTSICSSLLHVQHVTATSTTDDSSPHHMLRTGVHSAAFTTSERQRDKLLAAWLAQQHCCLVPAATVTHNHTNSN